jgi:hypothetical protein
VDEQGKERFSEVYMRGHVMDDIHIHNYEIEVELNSTKVTLSDVHRIPVTNYETYLKNGSVEKVYKYARDVAPGDALFVWNSVKKEMVVSPVLVIRLKMVFGQYAPITMSGTLVVDSVLVSSYGDMTHESCRWLSAPFRWWHQFIGPIPEYFDSDGVPWSASIIYHAIKYVQTIIGSH